MVLEIVVGASGVGGKASVCVARERGFLLPVALGRLREAREGKRGSMTSR